MRSLITAFAAVLILLSGCGSSSQKAQEALKSTAAAPAAIGDTGKATSEPRTPAATAQPPAEVAPTKVSQPTDKPKAASVPPTATPAPVELKLGAKGFGQDAQSIAYAFEIENPNPGFAVETSSYQVAVYDKSGTVLDSTSSYIELLLPGQALGVAGTLYLDSKDMVADHIEVQVKPGQYVELEEQPSFTVDRINYTKGSYSAKVTGILKSPYKQDVSQVKAYALAYDAADNLIGGGYTYVSFVPAEGQAPVEMSVVTTGEPARVAVFASLSGLSSFGGAASNAPDAQNIKLLAHGYGKDGQQVAFAFIVENPNTNVAIENSQYQAALYGKDGSLLTSDEGYIEVVLPGQKLGIAGDMSLPNESAMVDHLEVQLKPGKFTTTDPQPPFATDKVIFIKGDYGAYTTGMIQNPYTSDVSNVSAYAVAYDDQGEIIGGGYTYVYFVPAGQQIGVSISTRTPKMPAKVELYAALSGLSNLDSDASTAAKDVAVISAGFGQEKTRAAYGFVIENSDAANAIEKSQYHVTALAKDGTVLATDSGYIDLLLPGQKLGIAGSLSLPGENAVVERAVVQVKAGKLKPSDPQPTFTAEKVTYVKGSYDSKVTGIIKSPYKKDASQLRINALAYNAAGAIIGGGYGYLDFVPAEGQAATEVSVVTKDKPAKVELYASLTGLSDFE